MKEKIILFIVGVLLGAVISTGVFYVYLTSSNNSTNTTTNTQNTGNNQGGQPPEIPSGGNNQGGQPPEMQNTTQASATA